MYVTVNDAGEARQAPCCTVTSLPASHVFQIAERVKNFGYLPPPKLVCVKGLFASKSLVLKNPYELLGSDENEQAVTLVIEGVGLGPRHLLISVNPDNCAYPLRIRDFCRSLPAESPDARPDQEPTDDGVYVKVRCLRSLPLLEHSGLLFEYYSAEDVTLGEATMEEKAMMRDIHPMLEAAGVLILRGEPLSETDAFWDLMRVFQIPRDLRYQLVLWLTNQKLENWTDDNNPDLFQRIEQLDLGKFIDEIPKPNIIHHLVGLETQLKLMKKKLNDYLPWREKSRPLLLMSPYEDFVIAQIRWYGAHLVPSNAPISSNLKKTSSSDNKAASASESPHNRSPNGFSENQLIADRPSGGERPSLSSGSNAQSLSSPPSKKSSNEHDGNYLWWWICDASSKSLEIAVHSHPLLPQPYMIKNGLPNSYQWSCAYAVAPLYNEQGLGLPLMTSMLPIPEVYRQLKLTRTENADDLSSCERWLNRTPLQCLHYQSLPDECFPEVRLPPFCGSAFHLTISFTRGQYQIKETYPADSSELSGAPPTLRATTYHRPSKARQLLDESHISTNGGSSVPGGQHPGASQVDVVINVWLQLPKTPSWEQDAIIAEAARSCSRKPHPHNLPRERTVEHSLSILQSTLPPPLPVSSSSNDHRPFAVKATDLVDQSQSNSSLELLVDETVSLAQSLNQQLIRQPRVFDVHEETAAADIPRESPTSEPSHQSEKTIPLENATDLTPLLETSSISLEGGGGGVAGGGGAHSNDSPTQEEGEVSAAAAAAAAAARAPFSCGYVDLRYGDTLRIGALEFIVKRFNEGTACLQGCRAKMEDEEISIPDLCVSEHLPVSFYGIYDGHGGRECASYLKEELHLSFIHNLSIIAGDFDSTDKAELSIFEALYRSFVLTDRAYLKYYCATQTNTRWPNSNYIASTGGAASGSAAIVVMIVGNQIWCANTGDTRGVICRQNGQGVQLSLDHKPSRYDEEKRINTSGGFVRNRRVLGRLAVSRAFGDLEYKNVGLNRSALVVPDPEIRVIYNLQPDDEFILLACDGLFDVYETQELVQHVRSMLIEQKDAQLVVEDLILDAIEKRFSQDNVSATLILLS